MNGGKVLIKYIDMWRGNYYLRSDLTFSPDKNQAAGFHIKKDEDAPIISGDVVYISLDDEYINFNTDDQPHLPTTIKYFAIISATQEPITYNKPIIFIDGTGATLKYEWGTLPNSDFTPLHYPSLVKSTKRESSWLQLEPIVEHNYNLLSNPANKSILLIVLLVLLIALMYVNKMV